METTTMYWDNIGSNGDPRSGGQENRGLKWCCDHVRPSDLVKQNHSLHSLRRSWQVVDTQREMGSPDYGSPLGETPF